MGDFQMNSSDSDDYDSDRALQLAFARGELKPGTIVEEEFKRVTVNNVPKINAKLEQMYLKLPWIERMDIQNSLAPLAPELALQIEKHEQKRANMFAGNAKIPYVAPEADPVLNDFKREMIFHRQAQQASIEGIKKLHALGIATKRPDDYFAEMAKTDEQMQKVRSNLIAKQEGQAKSERVKQLREQRKMGKLVQKQLKVKREGEKKEMLDQLKKFRKGKLKNLDFLEDAKPASKKNPVANIKRKTKDKRFGFGGKKSGTKRNTKASSSGTDFKPKFKGGNSKTGGAGGKVGGGGRGGASQRPGKTRRAQSQGSKGSKGGRRK